MARAVMPRGASGVPCEIVLVDDCSTDGTRELLERHRGEPDITVLLHATNQGKGAALVDAIYGDFWNVVGLPVPELVRLLKTAC